MPAVTQCPPLGSQSEHVAGDKISSLPWLLGSAWFLLCTWLYTSRDSYQGGLELCLGLNPCKRAQVEPLAGVWCVCNAASVSQRIKCLPHPSQELFGDRMCVVCRGDAQLRACHLQRLWCRKRPYMSCSWALSGGETEVLCHLCGQHGWAAS